MKFRLAGLIGLLAVMTLLLGDHGVAQLRVPPFVSSTTTSSAAAGALDQMELFCRQGRCRSAEAWQREDLERQAQNRGQLRQMEQINHGCDGNCIIVDNSSLDWSGPQTVKAPNKSINLNTSITVRDASSNSTVRIDTSSFAGQSITQEVASSIALAAPQVMSFIQRQEHLDQVRQQFEQHYQAAAAAGRQYVEDLRNYSNQLKQQAAAARNSTLAQVGASLANLPLTGRSQSEREAAEEAKRIADSALRNTTYEMNEEGARLLDHALDRAVQERDWDEAARLMEALTYATVNGTRRQSPAANLHSNGDGVLKVGGPFDQRRFETNLFSSDGQIVRRLANRYQTLWQKTNGLELLDDGEAARYMAGALALSAGDAALAHGNLGAGSSLLRASEILADSVTGVAVGFGESLMSLVEAVPELAHLAKAAYDDPAQAWAATVNFAMNLDVVAGVMINGLIADSDILLNGSAYERGHVIGRYAIDVIALVASSGAAGATKALASGRGLSSAAAELKLLKKISHRIPRKALAEVEKSAKRVDDLANAISPSAKAGLKFHIERNPTVAQEISQSYHKALKQGRPHTAKYLERVAASRQPISTTAEEISEFHYGLSPRMKQISKASRDGVFSRAIPKEGIVNGKKVTFSKENVFQSHDGLFKNEHRFTIGGDLGHGGLYVTEGPVSKVAEVLAKETESKIGDLIFDSKNMKMDGLLDLTEPTTLKTLGLTEDFFLKNSYDFSQAIGDVAIENGFKGIIFRSSKDMSAINVAIFK